MLPTTINRLRTLWPTDISYELDRLFDDFYTHPAVEWTGWRPRADLFETDDDYRLQLDLPGFRVEDVNVTVDRGMLTISGEREMVAEKEGENYHVRERHVGKFARGFSLPTHLDAEHVKANLENGVLTVLLPKLAEAKPKQIEVVVK